MKFRIFYILTLLYSINLFGQNSQTIQVKYTGDNQNKYLKLAYYLGEKQFVPVDSVNQENGTYTFKSKDGQPFKGGLYMIYFVQGDFNDIVVSGKEDNIFIEADPNDFINTVKFKNSKENEKLISFRNYIIEQNSLAKKISEDKNINNAERQKVLKAKNEQVYKTVKNLVSKDTNLFVNKIILASTEINIPDEIYANQEKDSLAIYHYYKKHFFDHIDFSDARMLRTPYMQERVNRYFEKLVLIDKDSIILEADRVLKLSKQNEDVYRYILWAVTNKYEISPVIGLDGVFIYLLENYYLKDANWLTEDQKAKFRERLATIKPLETGKVFPKLILKDQNDVEIDLSSINSPYTIINFYSPDCSHCKEEAPELVEFYDKNKDKVKIFNVSVAYNKENWLNFIKDYKTQDFINVWDADGKYDFKNNFDVLVTPTVYLLNGNKEIIAKRIQIDEIIPFINYYESR